MAEAEAVPDAPSQEDLLGRVDLRQEVTFTIDGADAKDLDDAVHIKRLPMVILSLVFILPMCPTMSLKVQLLTVRPLHVGLRFM